MEARTILEVIEHLVGCPHAIGEHHTDKARHENLKTLTKVTENLMSAIIVESRNINSFMGSVKANGKTANKFLEDLRDTLDAVLEENKEYDH